MKKQYPIILCIQLYWWSSKENHLQSTNADGNIPVPCHKTLEKKCSFGAERHWLPKDHTVLTMELFTAVCENPTLIDFVDPYEDTK